jgi:hypothetical protein
VRRRDARASKSVVEAGPTNTLGPPGQRLKVKMTGGPRYTGAIYADRECPVDIGRGPACSGSRSSTRRCRIEQRTQSLQAPTIHSVILAQLGPTDTHVCSMTNSDRDEGWQGTTLVALQIIKQAGTRLGCFSSGVRWSQMEWRNMGAERNDGS